MRSRSSWLLTLTVAVLAIIPRVPPTLRGYHPSPDAAEHLLIARSLASGKGFQLPIRVRFNRPAPVVHDAHSERAPLYPLLLSWFVLRPVEPGWPDPHLQLLNTALCVLAAALACSLTACLGRQRGLRGRPLALATLAGGLAVAWFPFLVRASVHLWAEPLGLVLVLTCARLLVADPVRLGWGRITLLGLACGLARFARPEAWILVPLVLGWELAAGRRREVLALGGLALGVNALGVALTGVLAPQLDLLRVAHYEDLMHPSGGAGLSAATVAGGALSNLLHQLEAMLLPKNAFLVLPLALLGAGARAGRPLLLLGGGLVLATAAVWSTDDPSRFTIAPLCLLAPVAAVELVLRIGRWVPARGRRLALAIALGLWVAVLGHRAGNEWRREAPPPARQTVPLPGEPVLGDPWSYALLTGRPAILSSPPR